MKHAKDAFARLYTESECSVRVMAFGVHPHVSGAAHRIRYFEEMLDYFGQHQGVSFWTGDQIYEWFLAQNQPPPMT